MVYMRPLPLPERSRGDPKRRVSRRLQFVDWRYIDDAVGATDAVAPPELVAPDYSGRARRCFVRAGAMIVAIGCASTVVFGATQGLGSV